MIKNVRFSAICVKVSKKINISPDRIRLVVIFGVLRCESRNLCLFDYICRKLNYYEETYFWRVDDSGKTMVFSGFGNAGYSYYGISFLERI